MWLKFSFIVFLLTVVKSEQNVTTQMEYFTINNSTNQFTVINKTDNIKKFNDFKPSIQIDASLFGEQQSKTIDLPPIDKWSSWDKNSDKFDETSIETPWRYSKIKFPNDNSYIKPTEINNHPTKQPQSMWNKFMTFTGLNNQFPISSPKSSYNDYNSYHSNPNFLEHISYHDNNLGHNSYPNYGYYNPKEHYHPIEPHGSKISPWKKIFKVLATIIPLGLLLSALTPTIITVTPTNETESRFNRKNDAAESVMDKVAISLNKLQKLQQDGCEEKVLCELLVNAMFSKNAEEHIKNLLDNFIKRSGLNETNFLKVLEAVKNQNCSPIICRDVKDPT